jgi:hypothetical protein
MPVESAFTRSFAYVIARIVRRHQKRSYPGNVESYTRGGQNEYGETERREPQFYILNVGPAPDCIGCVSRISKDGLPWYVIENGLGALLAEGYNLRMLVSYMSRSWRLLHSNLLVIASFFGELLIRDTITGESVEVVLTSFLALS